MIQLNRIQLTSQATKNVEITKILSTSQREFRILDCYYQNWFLKRRQDTDLCQVLIDVNYTRDWQLGLKKNLLQDSVVLKQVLRLQNCPSDKWSGGNCHYIWGQIPLGQFSGSNNSGAIFRGAISLGGDCPGAIIQGAIFRGAAILGEGGNCPRTINNIWIIGEYNQSSALKFYSYFVNLFLLL